MALMSAKVATFLTAAALVVSGAVAKLAHFGPFADDAIRTFDTVAMSAPEFRQNYLALRTGTLVEKQAVDVACALFTSLADTGVPPVEWNGFENALADRMGVTDSNQYVEGKVDQLRVAVELAQHNVRAAAEYAKACIL